MAEHVATYAHELASLRDGVPNVDCYGNADAIWKLGECLTRQSRHAGRIMIPEPRPKGYVTATKNIGHYAYNKATAMRCRLRGDINAALVYESICDRIYKRLPEFARW